jgi:hypothetical protein
VPDAVLCERECLTRAVAELHRFLNQEAPLRGAASGAPRAGLCLRPTEVVTVQVRDEHCTNLTGIKAAALQGCERGRAAVQPDRVPPGCRRWMQA